MVERIAARGPKQDFFEQSQAITFHSMTYAFCYTKHPHLGCNYRISHKIRMATCGAITRSRLGGKLVFGDVALAQQPGS
jgi:hypothetical protein